MRTSSTLVRVATIAALVAAPTAFATSAYALSFVPSQSSGEQSSSSIVGLSVENANGDKLGSINYLVLDSTGKVTTAVIGIGGVLGVGEKNIGVPYSELKFGEKDGKQIVIIDATKDTLGTAPSYLWKEKSTIEKLKEDAERLTDKAKNAAGTNHPAPPPAETK
ncbi:hypothetical protein DLM45_11100 [Hyphomicrobium methylovorum]|uniref:PRC-barrel domain-containing protein n=1 Tax=Hyphomicrobium methylovorum TaxID=84 RepID=UPI0015E742E3|nr:PRC-barrel domain-containing protein [Hyphomicrobium methylovorum]MBA2126759.1 hypothetical protein [Hyphomicrobium methylovorum]